VTEDLTKEENMRKLLCACIFPTMLLGILAFTQPAGQIGTFKFGSEPDGFRGIKWGTHIAALDGMVKVWEDGDRTFYEREREVLEIGGAKLHRIVYVFWKDRLLETRVAILKDYDPDRGELANFNIVREICFERFGEQNRPFFGKEQYSWSGEKTWIYLGHEDPGFLRLVMGSKEMQAQMKAYAEKKARQETEYLKRNVREARGF
jgi:hypothetical protein